LNFSNYIAIHYKISINLSNSQKLPFNSTSSFFDLLFFL
jgi:hypothetical protein